MDAHSWCSAFPRRAERNKPSVSFWVFRFGAAGGIVPDYVHKPSGKTSDLLRVPARVEAAAKGEFELVRLWGLDRLPREATGELKHLDGSPAKLPG
jgi:hypothetical protein